MTCIVGIFNVNYYAEFSRGEINLEFKKFFSLKDTVYIFSNVLPLILSMAVCAGMGPFAGAVFACIATFLCGTIEEKKKMPIYASFLTVTFAFREFGASTAALSVAVCGLLLALSWKYKGSQKLETLSKSPIIGSVMFLSALTLTILFTTDYFGIGASGNTTREIIASYLSLGFHPNWRGVLYGTIVMVVMITFPRKFKKASKIVDAAFIALIITTALNLWLNPSDMITSINEIGTLSFTGYKSSILLPVFHSKPEILQALFCGISLYIINFYMIIQNENCQKSDFIIGGISNCVAGFGTCMAIPNITKKNKLISGFIASLLIGLTFFIFNDFIARIPVHSCAVVLIVGAWQSVQWSEVKKIFTSALNIAFFVLITIVCLLLGYIFTPLIAFVVLEVYSRTAPKTEK